MGTVFRLVFYSGQDSAVAYGLAKIIFDRIDSLNAHFSDWLPESELSMLCQKAGEKGCCRVSAELADILFKSNSFARQSRGAFDISVGALTRLWRRSRNLKELPAPEKLPRRLKRLAGKVSACVRTGHARACVKKVQCSIWVVLLRAGLLTIASVFYEVTE
jgi:thiamine biosynthesis lipoprotein